MLKVLYVMCWTFAGQHSCLPPMSLFEAEAVLPYVLGGGVTDLSLIQAPPPPTIHAAPPVNANPPGSK
jgi:hypothetical protein